MAFAAAAVSAVLRRAGHGVVSVPLRSTRKSMTALAVAVTTAPQPVITPHSVQRRYSAPPRAYHLNVNKAVDKAHEQKSFTEIISLPPSALQGLSEAADEVLSKLHIATIEDLGTWTYYKRAKAISALAATEEEGRRGETSSLNINKALIQKHETDSLTDLKNSPPSAFQGLAGWADESLAQLGMKTIDDVASNKYMQWAEALVVLAEYESSDFSSR
eukprot:m.211220 g.211220  ORF g.211220 m.211220 type:complete len:217 (+) comp18573_c0_seq5:1974-2624(+)